MQNKHLRNKHLLVAGLLHLVILVSATYLAWNYYHSNIKEVKSKTLSTLALNVDIKKTLIDKMLSTTETEILFLAQTGSLKLALDTLKTSWAELGHDARDILQSLYIHTNTKEPKSKLLNAMSHSNYDMLHETLHTQLSELKHTRHYKNILLLDMTGNVVYDVKKGEDFANNVQHKNTHISKVFTEVVASKVVEYVAYKDFSARDGSFFATAVSDENAEKIGVLVFEIDPTFIEKIAKLKAVSKEACTANNSSNEKLLSSVVCLNYQESYWLIQSQKSLEEVLSPVKEASLKHILIMLGIGLFSLFFGYMVLLKFLGRQGEEDE